MNLNCKKLTQQVRGGLVALTCVALLSAAPVKAQQNPGSMHPANPQDMPTPGAPMTGNTVVTQSNDKMFIRNALQGGMAEVELGKLALQKSSNDDVKQFAQRMVDDHTKLSDLLKPIADQMQIKVPDSPSRKDKKAMTKLQALSGDAFDKAYMKDQVKDHEKDQKEFKQEASSATDPQLKQVATQGEQIITEHLQMAKQIAHKDNLVASK